MAEYQEQPGSTTSILTAAATCDRNCQQRAEGKRTMNSTWRKVTQANPCPICGKSDWCKLSGDGAVALCGRIEQGSFKKARGSGGFFHRLIEKPKPDYGGNGQAHRQSAKPKPQAKAPKAYPDAQAAIDAAARMIGGSFVAAWTYHNRDGGEALRVIRYALADGAKQYRPIHLAKDGWRIGDPSGPLPLYRLHELSATGTVWVTEGEKAADAAARIGLTATTSAHGSGAADKSDWTPLAGRVVCILPDHDGPGRKYAQDVARLLVKLDPPAKVKIVDLSGLPDKGDVVEYIEARQGQAPETIRAEMEALAAKAPELPAGDLVGGPLLECLADVEAKEIAWLWPGRIALGRITLLVGRPGEGKSFLTIDMAARVTTGRPWPDGSDCPAGSVILVSAEDDPGDTIKPRLDAHKADCRKVHLLSAVRHIDAEGKQRDVLFTLADVAALETALKQHPDCKLIVVDPIGSFLGGDTDAHRDNEVRSVLAPVARLAEKYGPAVLVVAHRRKSAGSSADDLALGSRAFTGIARAVWHLSRDTDNKARRLLLPGKNNLAPEGDGLAFTICGDPPAIAWERDPVAMSADDALAQENGNGDDAKSGPEPEAMAQAAEWLQSELADLQEHPVKDLKNAAMTAGLSWRSVQRASAKLKVKVHRASFGGGCVWRLPKPAAPIRAKCVQNGEPGTNGTNGEIQGKTANSEWPECHTRQDVSLGTKAKPKTGLTPAMEVGIRHSGTGEANHE